MNETIHVICDTHGNPLFYTFDDTTAEMCELESSVVLYNEPIEYLESLPYLPRI